MTSPEELKTSPITKVQISFFKPTGVEDTYYVTTDDRGAAALAVLRLYDRELIWLNYVMTSHFDIRRLPANAVVMNYPVVKLDVPEC